MKGSVVFGSGSMTIGRIRRIGKHGRMQLVESNTGYRVATIAGAAEAPEWSG